MGTRDSDIRVQAGISVEHGGPAAALELCKLFIERDGVQAMTFSTAFAGGGRQGHLIDLTWRSISPAEDDSEQAIRHAVRPVLDRLGLAEESFIVEDSGDYGITDLPDCQYGGWVLMYVTAESGAAEVGTTPAGKQGPVLASAFGGKEIVARLHAFLAVQDLYEALQQCLMWTAGHEAFLVDLAPATDSGYDATILLSVGPGTDDEDSLRANALPLIQRFGLNDSAFAVHQTDSWLVGALEAEPSDGVFALLVRVGADPLSDLAG